MLSGTHHLDIPGAYNNEILRLSPQGDIPMRFLSNESLSP